MEKSSGGGGVGVDGSLERKRAGKREGESDTQDKPRNSGSN